MQSVDWPVDLIFWGNASISKITSRLGWFWPGSTIYEQVNDGAGAVWVGSGGRKNTLCTDTHYRLYADSDGYLTATPSSLLLGNYVIGTAHLDRSECFGTASYGFNEQAEATVAARARTVWGADAVTEDAQYLPDGTQTLTLLHNQVSYQDGPLLRQRRLPNGDPRPIEGRTETRRARLRQRGVSARPCRQAAGASGGAARRDPKLRHRDAPRLCGHRVAGRIRRKRAPCGSAGS